MPSHETQNADARVESVAASRDQSDDATLALALAQAARTVEHVVDLGVGRYGVAATYGPGQRITGIVLRRSTPSATIAPMSFVVEAHIVVATAVVTSGMTSAAQRSEHNEQWRPSIDHALSAPGTPKAPVLLRIADETRRVLAAALRQLRPNEKWDIDITVDDLRDIDAGVAVAAQ